MQEINYAGQESSARSSEPKEYRCLVCDGPVQRPYLVCRACSYRESQLQRWESYWEFPDDDDTTPDNLGLTRQRCQRRNIAPEQAMLIVLCGPSHAGKSTFAKKLGCNFTIISPDEIRKWLSISFGDSKHEAEVWAIYESMKRKAFAEGRNVVLDACHISKRARWHSLQSPNASRMKICVVFDLPLRTVRERCLKSKKISLKEVERMWKDFQKSKPTPEELEHEGFDEVYFITEHPACTTWTWTGCSMIYHQGGVRYDSNPIKGKFINEWEEYIDECNSLTMTPSFELSTEVKSAILNLRRLVARIAENKGLK